MNWPEIGFIALWTLALWTLGWLFFPLGARIFPHICDAGLAAMRFGAWLLGTLLIFWGSSLHIVPVSAAPVVFLVFLAMNLPFWKGQRPRELWRDKWRTLLASDAVFLVFWALFLWLRLRNPNASDFEKPMDMALLASAMKSDFLPFDNPWFHDQLFTNYYYFGHLMSATLAKTLGTPPHLAYNLAQAAFCAFFLSTLWSLGASLCHSRRFGFALAALVGLGGHLEPLRQISQSGKVWPLDWWSTSRVIPNTINEYPAFTLALGDLHGHFFALSFAALWLLLLWQIFHSNGKRFLVLLGICSAVLGAWLMTNTWDAPLFSLLLALVVWRRAESSPRKIAQFGAVILGAILVAAPYFLRFQSQVSGVQPKLFIPDLFSFSLFWGGWIILGCFALFLPKIVGDEEAKWRQMVIGVGAVALLAPCFFYIRGYFGDGDLRHQDTVFKFGLQAWLLLGVGLSAELFARWQGVSPFPKITLALAPLGAVLALAPLGVWKARAFDSASGGLSLNAMRFLPLAQQNAILWLQNEAPEHAVILERPQIKDGNPIGDYDPQIGKLATFSGVPTPLGWPQHVWMWGADYATVMERGRKIEKIYATQQWEKARALGATLIFFENNVPFPSPSLEIKSFSGEDGSTAAIGIFK